MSDRYFLKSEGEKDWREVDLTTYCGAERSAGFRPKLASTDPAHNTTPAASSFIGTAVSGRIVYGE